jgi:hypothetical protein
MGQDEETLATRLISDETCEKFMETHFCTTLINSGCNSDNILQANTVTLCPVHVQRWYDSP